MYATERLRINEIFTLQLNVESSLRTQHDINREHIETYWIPYTRISLFCFPLLYVITLFNFSLPAIGILCSVICTARCYAERGYDTVCRLSVRPFVRLSVRDIEVCFSHRLEYFENNFTAN